MSAPAPSPLTTWDRIVGPGATRAENALVIGASIAAGLALVAFVLLARPGWSAVTVVVVLLMAVDLGGGVVANSTATGARWWHRPGRSRWAPLRFVALHLHPFIAAALVPGMSWLDATVVYGVILSAALAVDLAPRDLARPVSLTATAAGLVVMIATTSPPPGIAWLGPVLLVKLVAAHSVPPAVAERPSS